MRIPRWLRLRYRLASVSWHRSRQVVANEGHSPPSALHVERVNDVAHRET